MQLEASGFHAGNAAGSSTFSAENHIFLSGNTAEINPTFPVGNSAGNSKFTPGNALFQLEYFPNWQRFPVPQSGGNGNVSIFVNDLISGQSTRVHAHHCDRKGSAFRNGWQSPHLALSARFKMWQCIRNAPRKLFSNIRQQLVVCSQILIILEK